MEDIVDAFHGILEGALVAHVANVEFDFAGYLGHTCLEVVTHVVLFLLVTREDAYLTDVGAQETIQHRVAETACTTCDEQHFIFKD